MFSEKCLEHATLQHADPRSLVAGNRSGVGKDTSLYRKVKHEQRKHNWLHEDEITALRILKNELEDKDTNSAVMKGFIQLIKVAPLKVICFSEAGVRLWHSMIKDSAASWDATGGIIKSKLTQKRILYYEIVVSCSVTRVSTPVAFMISEEHSQTSVEELLTELRRKERNMFGNNTTPIQMNSDRSIVLLKASMHIFNGDSMSMYLLRCWRIVTGGADRKDLNFCIIRACKSHLMRQASHICKEQYITRNKSYRLAMYIFSVLLNATTLKIATDIVFAACIVLGSKSHSKQVEASVASIRAKTQNLPKEGEHQQDAPPYDNQPDDNMFDFDDHCESTNPFKDHFKKVREK